MSAREISWSDMSVAPMKGETWHSPSFNAVEYSQPHPGSKLLRPSNTKNTNYADRNNAYPKGVELIGLGESMGGSTAPATSVNVDFDAGGKALFTESGHRPNTSFKTALLDSAKRLDHADECSNPFSSIAGPSYESYANAHDATFKPLTLALNETKPICESLERDRKAKLSPAWSPRNKSKVNFENHPAYNPDGKIKASTEKYQTIETETATKRAQRRLIYAEMKAEKSETVEKTEKGYFESPCTSQSAKGSIYEGGKVHENDVVGSSAPEPSLSSPTSSDPPKSQHMPASLRVKVPTSAPCFILASETYPKVSADEDRS